jgi:DNA-binding FadR family transcriptional regulator
MDKKGSIEERLSRIVSLKPSQSAVDFVINTIKDLLIDGYLQPGDRIPSENELTRLLAVSRGSIREAMKILSALGVIRIQRGDGTYIADSGDNIAMDSMLFSFILAQPTLKEIYDLRILIETGVMQAAIDNATAENIGQLRACLDEMKRAASSGGASTEDFTRMDIRFHEVLGSVTGNRLIKRLYSYIMGYLSHSAYEFRRRENEYAEKAIDSHSLMLEVIIQRDKTRVGEAVRFAVDTWRAILFP